MPYIVTDPSTGFTAIPFGTVACMQLEGLQAPTMYFLQSSPTFQSTPIKARCTRYVLTNVGIAATSYQFSSSHVLCIVSMLNNIVLCDSSAAFFVLQLLTIAS
ncbi:ribosome-like motif protein [Ranid herpesvirus 3]|uniref:Ribosome-like motif protein n=1 Tax=Ranid herpesvirus 3 TaxID=1987509 RepID=A0A1X9T553_9VIRU|nr:ribosome-like motif protein [Ranid herpesvirus 3]ARR28832.1 ribosome-like motif protein [Ranid herpesvirus 3]